MAYVFTLLAVLGVFVWFTPAHVVVEKNIRASIAIIESTAASGSEPLKARLIGVKDSILNKAMELLRQELHRSVDGLVK